MSTRSPGTSVLIVAALAAVIVVVLAIRPYRVGTNPVAGPRPYVPPATRPAEDPLDEVYDNRGGYAYDGHVLKLYRSGACQLINYSDCVGEVHPQSGTFTTNGSTITVTIAGKSGSYHRLRNGQTDYLLGSARHQEYLRSADEGLLYAQMRRVPDEQRERYASGHPAFAQMVWGHAPATRPLLHP